MKKVLIFIFAMILLLNFYGCARPFGKTINNNKEMAQYISILKEDFPKIKEKLEILRIGVFETEGYTIYTKSPSNDYQIALTDGITYFDFMESLDLFSQEEVDAINYLLFSDELQLHALSIHSGDKVLSSGAIFAEEGRYVMGIHYYETNDIPNDLQNSGDYIEELDDNYYIVFLFMETV